MKNPTPKTPNSEHLCRVPQDSVSRSARSQTHDTPNVDRTHGATKPGGLSRVLGESLRAVDLFADLDERTRQAIGAVCRSRRYAAGQPLVSQGDAEGEVFFLLEGSVRATLYSVTGREVAFEDLATGALFGELSAIDARPRATSVVALSDCSVAVMSPASFKAMLESHPGIAWQILTRLTVLVRALCDRVFEYSTLDVRERVRAEVLRLAEGQLGQTAVRATTDTVPALIWIEQFPTHAELAARISTHREAVTREINALDRAGIITREDGGFAVCDLPALANMVHALRA